MSNMIAPGCQLIDAADMQKRHPRTFDHPPPRLLAQIQTGHFVKVGVESISGQGSGERFWGLVKSRTDSTITIVVTQVDMRCSGTHGILDKDVLVVEPRHIFKIMLPNGYFLD